MGKQSKMCIVCVNKEMHVLEEGGKGSNRGVSVHTSHGWYGKGQHEKGIKEQPYIYILG